MGYYDRSWWPPKVPASVRRAQALREVAARRKAGRDVTPVVVVGRTIARSFWGQAWCRNLESYSDYENRLGRGRTYVRQGSVIDLRIGAGTVNALVSGSDIYKVAVEIGAVPKPQWKSICRDCSGSIDSALELLEGRLDERVMTRISAQHTGLFPSPREITFTCTCPDWAVMCKHVAAVFYGIGARLDAEPELLFTLRRVDHRELIARAGRDLPRRSRASVGDKRLKAGASELAEVFGIDLAPTRTRGSRKPKPKAARAGKTGKRVLPRKSVPPSRQRTTKPAPKRPKKRNT